MSDPAATPVASPVSRFRRVLDVVRKLIDYGKELATTLQQRAATDLAAVTFPFGTRDISLILARITRGRLHHPDPPGRQRNVHRVRRGRKPPGRPRRPTTLVSPSCPHRSRSPPKHATGLDPVVRRRPIGAVIADICRDLGIIPTHPLWQELSVAIIWHGGSFNRLFKDIFDRVLPNTARRRSVAAPAGLAAPAPAATGPP